MIIYKKADHLSSYLKGQKETKKKIGFVPTMGALHKGHLSLIQTAKKNSDVTVCSIFINPAQFNNSEDFKYYPVTIEKDIEQLLTANCDVLFLPSVDEIYPASYKKKKFELGNIENILEGYYRPGHFQGVCQVVDRLLEIVQPNNLFLGQKDFQQCMVIKKMIDLTGKENAITINMIPTIREEDGLAMSSRNLRLNQDQRKLAPAIFQSLSFIQENLHKQSLDQLKNSAKKYLEDKRFSVDYIEIVNANDLSIAIKAEQSLVVLIAATIDGIRLIDNILLQ